MPPSRAEPHRSLLLLPPAPSPPTYAALKAAYNSCLSILLRQLARSPQRTHRPATLDIALPCPHLYGRLKAPRGPLYATTQSLVANLYKLISVLSSIDSIDTEDARGVDARIILVAYPRDGKLTQTEDASPEEEAQGPAIELHTLARSPRTWDAIYSVESEQGEALLGNFLRLGPSRKDPTRVRGGIVQVASPEATPTEGHTTSTNHLSVAVGGTFDHLHIGHKLLLTMFAFVLGRKTLSTDQDAQSTLTIGITGDELLKNKKYAQVIESWSHRQRATHEYLSSVIHFGQPHDTRIAIHEKNDPGPNGHVVIVSYPSGLVVNYVEIMDPFGPTITNQSISALVISKETRSGGKAVNTKREEKGWDSLEVFEVDVLDAGEEETVDETFQSKLSSTEIRRILSKRAEPNPA
jgi:phosphopantetheine adenylyltransferase